MAIAYWCILVAALLPYGWVVIAKRTGPRYNNRDPRQWIARQEEPRVQRAYAAHLNAFEAFAPFAAGVLMAQAAGVPVGLVQGLALAFVAFRILHGVFYLLLRYVQVIYGGRHKKTSRSQRRGWHIFKTVFFLTTRPSPRLFSFSR